jgi:hypothetical protein
MVGEMEQTGISCSDKAITNGQGKLWNNIKNRDVMGDFKKDSYSRYNNRNLFIMLSQQVLT